MDLTLCMLLNRYPCLFLFQSASSVTSPSPAVSKGFGAVMAPPWSYVATADWLAITCYGGAGVPRSVPANATMAGSTLPPNLIGAFRSGLWNLTLQVGVSEVWNVVMHGFTAASNSSTTTCHQSCNISGTLPAAWSDYAPLAPGYYLNLYPGRCCPFWSQPSVHISALTLLHITVYIDLSHNLITGDLPGSWVSSLSSCYVSRLNLGYNKVLVTLCFLAMFLCPCRVMALSACRDHSSSSHSTPLQLSVAFSSDSMSIACGSMPSPCVFFKANSRSLAAFARHGTFNKGPTSVDSLVNQCGLVTALG